MGLRGRRLKGLTIDENSGVDAPAHLAPGWIVRKAEGSDDLDDRIVAALDELEKQLGIAGQEEKPVEQFVAALTKARDAMSDEAEKAKVDAAIKALAGDTAAGGAGGGKAGEGDGAAALAKAQADATAEKAAREAAEARATKAEAAVKAMAGGKDPDPEADELTKAMATLPEALRKAWEADRARIAKAEANAATERDARLSREYLEKARGFEGLVVKAETLGTVLREVDEKLTKEAAAEIGRILKAASEAVASSDLFREHGGPGADVTEGEAALVAKAEEIHKAAATAGAPITKAEAMVRAGDLHPDLVNRRGA